MLLRGRGIDTIDAIDSIDSIDAIETIDSIKKMLVLFGALCHFY